MDRSSCGRPAALRSLLAQCLQRPISFLGIAHQGLEHRTDWQEPPGKAQAVQLYEQSQERV